MSKRQIFGLISIAVVWFLFSIVANTPATFIFSKLNQSLASRVQIVEPQGSIWNGSASQLVISMPTGRGALVFEELRWKLNAWRFLLGQLSLDLHTKPEAAQALNVNLIVDLFGAVQLNDFSAKLNAGLISQSMSLPAQVEGELHLKSAAIHIKNKKLVKLADNAEFKWLRASFTFTQQLKLGDYLGKLSRAEDGALNIRLKDLNALLKADGNIRIELSSPPKYDVDVLLQPRSDFPQDMTNMLSMVGQPDGQGRYRIKRSR